MLEPTTGNNVGSDTITGREAIAGEIQRFVADTWEEAGGPQAISSGLAEMGFVGRDGPFTEAAIRAWRNGGSMPGGDVLFALSARWGVPLDYYVEGGALKEKVEELQRRLAAMAPAEPAITQAEERSA